MYGYNREEFKIQPAINNIRNSGGKLLKQKDSENPTKELQIYSYKHDEVACYYCMVSAKDASMSELELLYKDNLFSDEYKEKKKAYYMALARERNNLVKISDYINSSGVQY